MSVPPPARPPRASASRKADHSCNSRCSRDLHMLARWIEGNFGFQLGIKQANFIQIHRVSNRRNFRQSHVGRGVNQPWIHLQSTPVYDTRATSRSNSRPEVDDLAVHYQNRSIVDLRPGHRMNRDIPNQNRIVRCRACNARRKANATKRQKFCHSHYCVTPAIGVLGFSGRGRPVRWPPLCAFSLSNRIFFSC